MAEIEKKLKRVSAAKLLIWERYLAWWLECSADDELFVVDLFAGSGIYAGGRCGSPIIAAEAIQRAARRGRKAVLVLVESDHKRAKTLSDNIRRLFPDLPPSAWKFVIASEAQKAVPFISQMIGDRPALVLIDPYGYPIPILQMRALLGCGKVELLVNLMWFRINMDIFRAGGEKPLRKFWGTDVSPQLVAPLRRMRKRIREAAFISMVAKKIGTRFHIPFRVCYGPDDVRGKLSTRRTKYFLVHFSNELRSALAARDVMWSIGDFPGAFEYAGIKDTPGCSEGDVISREKALRRSVPLDLLRMFAGRELTVGSILEATLHLRCRTDVIYDSLRAMVRDGLLLADRRISKNAFGAKVLFPYAHIYEDRVDGGLVEPCDGVQQGERGLRSLLRGTLRKTAA